MEDLISLIIPIYNTEKYLTETLICAINQDYPNLEIICVDDGSTDNSVKIIKSFMQKFPKLKLVQQSNSGPSEARNNGIIHSKGNYIAFLDSDDLITKDYISYMYTLIKKHNADIASVKMESFTDKIPYTKTTNTVTHYNSTEKLLKDTFENKGFSVSCDCKLFKREIFDLFKFKKGVIYEDTEFIVNVYTKFNNLIDSNSVRYFYRQREGSTMHSSFTDKNKYAFTILDNIEKLIKDNNYDSVLSEFYYYKLCLIGDQYKYLMYSNYKDKNTQNFIRKSYKETLETDYRKDLISLRQKVLWNLILAPKWLYKFIVNLIRLLK